MAKILIALTVLCTPYSAFADKLTAGEVTIRFYTGSSTDDYTDYAIESAEGVVNNSAWNSSKPIVLYIHGLTGSVNDTSTLTIVAAYLGIETYNVLAINYAKRAEISLSIVHNVVLVGVALGELINRLVAAGVDLSTIHLIGFGLGPHVAANAATVINGTLSRITALDPALPAFYKSDVTHIKSTDATVVDVIHGDCDILGIADAIGTVDFYPNSGYALQPGCSLLLTSFSAVACSSDQSWYWWASSVTTSTAFEAIGCDSWDEFESGTCTGSTDHMGYGYSQNNTGKFYLQTQSASPYSKGDSGIVYDSSSSSILISAVLAIVRAVVKSLLSVV